MASAHGTVCFFLLDVPAVSVLNFWKSFFLQDHPCEIGRRDWNGFGGVYCALDGESVAAWLLSRARCRSGWGRDRRIGAIPSYEFVWLTFGGLSAMPGMFSWRDL